MDQATAPQIEMTPVESSLIHSVGFHPETSTLAIRFKKKGEPGTLYHYPNWTAEKHAALLEAESIGKHFGEFIKSNPEHPHKEVV